ncbi:GPI biosynthesis protein Pig-F [Metarhizium album ARSEF 1941]|uniref:GPI biosynthesis protein Pig-F n=1 Tax=Metarhizium album (strain ARSEF 1941) TaxID=1081103 RepID=A0A0B2X645_METAS|nr:GPI biosynthesis protein Pig-F [Metarhizium album ARSEF 1941]KHO00741.1 GPI biosynthesis protein Pig-F [Metarhizium album ARSEF 1941]
MASPIPTMNQANSSHHHSPQGATPSSPPNKRDLKSWWKGFKLPSKQQDPPENKAPGIFGVPLRQSITYANVAISLLDENGKSYIYGYVPIVVAKCGVFLKEKGMFVILSLSSRKGKPLMSLAATGIEGIFRLSGSEKRIKELKHIFDSPDRYGKGLVWDGYTVHDAANVLRRYLNDLPEPVVPLALYEKFRDPLRGATKQPTADGEGPQFVENFDEQAAIKKYQQLITELPPLNRQLLLYILDLLAVFAAKSDENRMNSQNLSAIFQPGMLSHPNHAMAPEEYRLNQCVLIFLIENQDHFLIGMQGTAADENTKKEVESGTPTTPNAAGVNRSASTASAGANSVRKEGQLRRNRSTSSRHSRGEGSVGSHSPSLATSTTGGLGRSNTVPSKKSPGLAGGKFRKLDSPGQQSPARLEPMTPVRPAMAFDESKETSLDPPAVGFTHVSTGTAQTSAPSQERLLEVPQEFLPAPTKERNLPSLFQRSSAESSDKRQPNKLKKKRIPGSMNISAHSSTASLPHSNAASPAREASNPMETMQHISEKLTSDTSKPPLAEETNKTPLAETQNPINSCGAHVSQTKAPLPHQSSDLSSEPTPRASQIASGNSLRPDDHITGKKSPPTSIHSSFNEGSDLDQTFEGQTAPQIENPDKEKKRRWRLSRTRRDDNDYSSGSLVTPSPGNLGSNTGAETSTTTVGSGGSKTRRSFQHDGSESHLFDSHGGHDGERENGKDDPKGPIGWIKNKYREAKENAEQRRNKSPPADRHEDRQALGAALASRGKSLDLKREGQENDKAAEKPSETSTAEKAAEKEVIEPVIAAPTHHDNPKFTEVLTPTATAGPLEPVLETLMETPTEQIHTVTEAPPAKISEGKPGQSETEVPVAPAPAVPITGERAPAEAPAELGKQA